MTSLDRQLTFELLAPVTSEDAHLVGQVVDLVNDVYRVAEAGLWVDGATRTTPTVMTTLVAAGEIAVARRDDTLLGCVRCQRLDESTGEFGMLAADPRHRGTGIGRRLVHFAERRSRELGCRTMQLELLRPRHWAHPAKDFLHAWYTRLGYRVVRGDTIDAAYPDLAPLLATPCDYVVYQRSLQVSG